MRSVTCAALGSLAQGCSSAWRRSCGRGVSTACGKPKVMGRISGGRDVEAGQWPWQASLQSQGSHVCGAVLVNSRWLLSTAHCFLKKPKAPESYRVLLGSTQLYQHGPQSQEVPVSRIVTHPDFEKLHPFGSDIAMLQLLSPVNFTSSIVPACLPAPGMKLPSNSSCWITGWGMLSEETPLLEPFHLQEGKVSFIENKFCNMLYGHAKGKNFSVHEDMLCAGDFSTGKSICHLPPDRFLLHTAPEQARCSARAGQCSTGGNPNPTLRPWEPESGLPAPLPTCRCSSSRPPGHPSSPHLHSLLPLRQHHKVGLSCLESQLGKAPCLHPMNCPSLPVLSLPWLASTCHV
nr:putative serine protease 47 isoform X2 [Odocoileus virginianus texanus]